MLVDAANTPWTVTGATADDEHVALRNALLDLTPARPDYASAPILDAFNWSEAVANAPPGSWYLVSFRSVLVREADAEALHIHDRAALGEALAHAPGLLVYFAGGFDAEGRSLSFCLWTDASHARKARVAPRHLEAVGIANKMYQAFALDTGQLTKHRDGRITFDLTGPTADGGAHALGQKQVDG
jgi:hypothetical protein